MKNSQNIIINKYYYALPVIILSINLIIFNRFFMPIDGWWTTYGYLINDGLIPYKDFSTAIVPFFMYFNAFLLNIFGESMFTMRLIGVITVLFTYLLLQWLLSQIVDKKIAAIAVFSAFALNMSTPVYLAYDYTSFIDVLIIIIFIMYHMLCNTDRLYKAVLYSFLLGIVISVLVLMKQNIGVFFGLSVLLSLFIFLKKYKLMSITSAFIGFIGVLLLFNSVIDLGEIFQELFIKNDAKGSVTTVLLRFLFDPYNLKILLLAISFNLGYIFVFKYKLKIVGYLEQNRFYKKINFNKEKKRIIFQVLYALVLIFSFMVFFHVEFVYVKFLILMKVLTIAVIIHIAYSTVFEQESEINNKFKYYILLVLSLIYTTTHSAGYNFIGLYFVVAFALSYLLHSLKELKYIKYGEYLFILIMISIAFTKIMQPYNWWGLTQDSVFKAKYETEYKQLKGIKVDKKTKMLFDVVKNSVDKYSTEINDTLFYPDLPIFYMLHHKRPPGKLMLQWFDFATSSQLKKDLVEFKKNPPKLLVMLIPPKFVYKGHYKLLKHNLVQVDYDNYFNRLLLSGKYKIVDIHYYMDMDKINQNKFSAKKVVVTNKKLIGKSINNLFKNIDNMFPGSYEFKSMVKNGHIIKFDKLSYKDYNSIVIDSGDILNLNINLELLNDFVKDIGYVLDEDQNYVLKILVRND